MSAIRGAIARIVERNLESILDATMDGFIAEIPRIKESSPEARARVRASTRRATLAFLALYADAESPARMLLDEARRATIDRAGEAYEREEILAMFRIARHTIFHRARDLVQAEMGHDLAREEDTKVALEAFIAELEQNESLFPQADDALHHLLVEAEREEPDVG